MGYPRKTRYYWIGVYKAAPGWLLLVTLLLLYILINIGFSIAYYYAEVLGSIKEVGFINNLYFTFVTSFTIGYGDFTPKNDLGKFIVIFQSCVTALYFAIMIALLSAKMFYSRNTIQFSKKIYCSDIDSHFGIRIINTHKEPLINPEIRIFFMEHCAGNVIASFQHVTKNDEMPYLGKHDFTQYFSDIVKNDHMQLSILDEWKKAMYHNSDIKNENESRFRIIISVAGNYGVQEVVYYKKYRAGDIEFGKNFKAIKYNKEDQRKHGNMRFTKFDNFWNDFNEII